MAIRSPFTGVLFSGAELRNVLIILNCTYEGHAILNYHILRPLHSTALYRRGCQYVLTAGGSEIVKVFNRLHTQLLSWDDQLDDKSDHYFFPVSFLPVRGSCRRVRLGCKKPGDF